MPLSYRAPLMFPSHCTVFHATSTYAVQAASQLAPSCSHDDRSRRCRCACKRVVGASLRPAPTISAHARGARTTTGSASPRASLGQFSPASITRLCPSHEHAGCVLGEGQAMAFLLPLGRGSSVAIGTSARKSFPRSASQFLCTVPDLPGTRSTQAGRGMILPASDPRCR